LMRELFSFATVYCGLIAEFVCLIKPVSLLGVRSRGRALILVLLGLIIVAVGWALPPREVHVADRRVQLDRFAPVYQFSEFHSIDIPAPRERVYRAMKSVTADEILLFRTLTWIRRFGRPGPEGILNPSTNEPLLDVATRTWFFLLAEDPDRELVVGTVVMAPQGWRSSKRPSAEDFRALHEPGLALAAMNFLAEDRGPSACRLRTETRVYATGASAQRRLSAGDLPGKRSDSSHVASRNRETSATLTLEVIMPQSGSLFTISRERFS